METGRTRRSSIEKKNNAKPKSASPVPSDDDDLTLFFTDEEASLDTGSRGQKNTGIKISISNLPDSMTEEQFYGYFGDLPPHNYFFYKPALEFGNMRPFCAAIINFLNRADAADWIERIHGIVIVDPREEEFEVECNVMYNQDLPKLPVFEDDELVGTLEDTEEYQEMEDRYEDVFADPPIPFEVLQDTMLREIEERKAKQSELQDTPLVKYLQRKTENEREKSRVREEAAAALRKAKDDRRQEQREKESKDRRRERMAKEKLRKEASRRAKKLAKQLESKEEYKKKSPAPERSEHPVTSQQREGEEPEAVPEVKAAMEDQRVSRNPRFSRRPFPQESTQNERIKKEGPPHSGKGGHKEKEPRTEGRYGHGSKSYKNSSRGAQWEHETNWRTPKSKGDRDKGPVDSSSKTDATAKDKNVDSTPCQDSTETPSTSTPSAVDARKEPKKKIVKKIVRVRKVKSSETGSSSSHAGTETKQVDAAQGTTGSAKSERHPSTSAATSSGANSGETAKPLDTKEKPRRSRPDREVYRPGAWRRNSAAERGQGQAQKKDSETPKPPPPPASDS